MTVLAEGTAPPLSRADQQARTRRRLLRAGAKVFVREGFHATSLERVAAEAGYTSGAVYSNFRSKEDLFLTLVDEYLERRTREIASALATHTSAPALLHEGAEHWVRMAADRADELLLFMEFWTYAVRRPHLRDRLTDHLLRFRTAVAELLRARAESSGAELAMDPDDAATALIGLARGLALERIAAPESVPDELFASAFALVLGVPAPGGGDR